MGIKNALRIGYCLTILICFIPLAIGFIVILAPAFSWLPVAGLHTVSLSAWRELFTTPSLSHSIFLSLGIALCTTVLTILCSFLLLARFYTSSSWARILGFLSPVFALPHVAFAIGFAFLFTPSGWFFRLIHTLFGTTRSDVPLLVHDKYAIGMCAVITIKEIIFLLLMSIAPLQQMKVKQLLTVGTSLGYHPLQVWAKIILPQWLVRLRFPIAAMIGYSLSVVDVGLVLAPLRPAPLAIVIWQWIKEPNLSMIPVAAAGSMVLLVLAMILVGFFRLIEHFMCTCSAWQVNGSRSPHLVYRLFNKITLVAYTALLLLPVLSTAILVVWSYAFRWRYPHLLPQSWTFDFWKTQWSSIQTLFISSISIAILSTLSSLILSIICLEYNKQKNQEIPAFLIIIPLVAPQIGLLLGMQLFILKISYIDYFYAVVWGHLIFVFPYVYLSLVPAWRIFDNRYQQVASSLGSSPLQSWFRVKLPILKNAILFALVIGMSVSLTQYLPTLMLGAGRITTITTEAIAVTSGHDRRIMAVYGLMQALLPFMLILWALYSSFKLKRLRV